jgi:predicted DNA-binding transcriptional regulator AlpA
VNKDAIGYGYTPQAYTITQFADAHHVSRTHVYALLKAGKGPRVMKLGRRTLVSVEAAADWRRQIEKATATAAA